MSDSDSDGRKSDNFSTFLDVLTRSSSEVRDRVSRGVAYATSRVIPDTTDLPNTLIQLLAAHGGTSSISELLVPPFVTISPLMAAIKNLQTFGLAETDGPIVRLTTVGEDVARKIGSPSAPAPRAELGS